MQLLSGADISIRFDTDNKVYVVVIGVGSTYTEMVDKDPVQALGVACLIQAGYTPAKLNTELKDLDKPEEGRWTGTGIGDAGGWEGLTPPPGWTRDPND